MERFVYRMIFGALARFLVAVFTVDKIREGFSAQFIGLISMHVGEGLIHLENRFPIVNQNRDTEPGLLENALPLVDLDLRFPPLADVAEHQYHPKYLIVKVANGC